MSENRKPLVLVVNDDGIASEGLVRLARAARVLGRVFVVAPDRQRSATSLALTLHGRLRARRLRPAWYAVDGTPADCVYLAVCKILGRRPDLVLSGINSGPNLGRQDIAYSGTVAGAIQGTFIGIPSLAISQLPNESGRFDYDTAASLAVRIGRRLLSRSLPEGITLSCNVPPAPVRGLRLAKLGERCYSPEIIETRDTRLGSVYRIGAGNPRTKDGPGTDLEAVRLGYASLTPIHSD
ncbi:MAG: 5'/3'-nucleotidase SurE, partial [Candidatus Aminicenantes bacterium]|nr:5'/3'-nucleotidase SurE [Candidatus Aminicenantes bacterium]